MPIIKEDTAEKAIVGEERTRYLACSNKLMMTVIDFEDGPCNVPDPPHSHPHEQVTYVAEGELLFFLGNEQTRVEEGDIVVVPSGMPHSVQPLSPLVRLVDTFTPIRDDFL